MDASALLTRQGWRGHGHALDHRGRGVKKPLLVSQKSNTLGVGKKKVDVHADQWWARAFDAGLKELDVGSKESITSGAIDGSVKAIGKKDGDKTVDSTAIKKIGTTKVSELSLLANGGRKWLGLYDGFVRGQGLEGTIGRAVVEGGSGLSGSSHAAEEGEDGGGEAIVLKEEKRMRKKKRREERLAAAATSAPETAADDKIAQRKKRSKQLGSTKNPYEPTSNQGEEPKKKKKKRVHKDQDTAAG